MPDCKHYRSICVMCGTIIDECDCATEIKPETLRELCDECADDDDNKGGRRHQRRTKVRFPHKIV